MRSQANLHWPAVTSLVICSSRRPCAKAGPWKMSGWDASWRVCRNQGPLRTVVAQRAAQRLPVPPFVLFFHCLSEEPLRSDRQRMNQRRPRDRMKHRDEHVHSMSDDPLPNDGPPQRESLTGRTTRGQESDNSGSHTPTLRWCMRCSLTRLTRLTLPPYRTPKGVNSMGRRRAMRRR